MTADETRCCVSTKSIKVYVFYIFLKKAYWSKRPAVQQDLFFSAALGLRDDPGQRNLCDLQPFMNKDQLQQRNWTDLRPSHKATHEPHCSSSRLEQLHKTSAEAKHAHTLMSCYSVFTSVLAGKTPSFLPNLQTQYWLRLLPATASSTSVRLAAAGRSSCPGSTPGRKKNTGSPHWAALGDPTVDLVTH